jgi:hypothetical protein
MQKYMVADLVKAVQDDEIAILLGKVEAGLIGLDDAQEEAWVIYGYPEGGTKSGGSKSRWAERLNEEGSEVYVEVDYEPMFESLGNELDEDPIWEVTRISMKTEGDVPHNYDLSGKYEHTLESIQYLEENSPMRWFNQYVVDHRFRSK